MPDQLPYTTDQLEAAERAAEMAEIAADETEAAAARAQRTADAVATVYDKQHPIRLESLDDLEYARRQAEVARRGATEARDFYNAMLLAMAEWRRAHPPGQ